VVAVVARSVATVAGAKMAAIQAIDGHLPMKDTTVILTEYIRAESTYLGRSGYLDSTHAALSYW
jgi:hypothetical protein